MPSTIRERTARRCPLSWKNTESLRPTSNGHGNVGRWRGRKSPTSARALCGGTGFDGVRQAVSADVSLRRAAVLFLYLRGWRLAQFRMATHDIAVRGSLLHRRARSWRWSGCCSGVRVVSARGKPSLRSMGMDRQRRLLARHAGGRACWPQLRTASGASFRSAAYLGSPESGNRAGRP